MLYVPYKLNLVNHTSMEVYHFLKAVPLKSIPFIVLHDRLKKKKSVSQSSSHQDATMSKNK